MDGGHHLFREELLTKLEQAHIANDNNRTSHLLMWAELEGIICSGKIKNNKITYALLSEIVPKTKIITRDEALEKLTLKSFTSHCPATLQDFAWWSGLSVTESKNALEMIKSSLVSETIDSKTYWYTYSTLIPQLDNDSVCLLPAYDEYIISYKDRTASLPLANFNKAVSINGIFIPTIVINGQARGLWKRTIKKDKIILEKEFFEPVNKATLQLIEKAAVQFEHFMNKRVELI